MTEFKLTRHNKHNKHCKDGKRRSYILYFINNVQIFRHKNPYNENDENGYHNTSYYDTYILNGKLYQTRITTGKGKTRNVSFPLSRKILAELQIPDDLKIMLE